MVIWVMKTFLNRRCFLIRWLDSIIDSKDMNLTKLKEIEKPGVKSGVLQSMGSQRVGDDLATEQ